MPSFLTTYSLNLWGRYYEPSVVGLNERFGPHIPQISYYHNHTPTLNITFIPNPTIPLGGSHQQEALLNSTVMGLNHIEVPQQDLYFAIEREVLFWQELAM